MNKYILDSRNFVSAPTDDFANEFAKIDLVSKTMLVLWLMSLCSTFGPFD